MEYPQLAPTLSALDGVKMYPVDGETRSKLTAVDRQTRMWLFEFLSIFVDAETNKLKSSGFSTNSIPPGGVRGSESNSGVQREVTQGTISTPDLRDSAVSSDKIVDGAVGESKIANDAITTAKIADTNVTTAKIVDKAITTEKINDAAVTGAQIASAAIDSTKIANSAIIPALIAAGAVTGEKLPTGTSGQLLVHNGTTWVPTTITGSVGFTGAGVTSVSLTSSSTGWVRVSEKVASGTHAGASAAASWAQKRGVATSWVIDEQAGGTIVALGSSGKINLQANGVYIVYVRVPAYSAGLHKVKMTFTPVSGPAVDYISNSGCAGPGTVTIVELQVLLNVTGASSGTPATLDLFHWTELVKATNGLGIACGSTEVERYAMIEMLRVSAS